MALLNPDPNKLRFWGLDLQSRPRRRVVVVLHYAMLLIALRAIAVAAETYPVMQLKHSGFWLMLMVTLGIDAFGVFREGGALERSAFPVWRLSGSKNGWVMLGGLDDRARYWHGKRFDALAEDEQKEILRTYRVGNYLFPAKEEADQRLDAGELAEKGRASSGALTVLAGFCYALAAIYGVSTMELRPDDLAAVFLGLGFVAFTGAKAYVLWTAPDPRVLGAVETRVPGRA